MANSYFYGLEKIESLNGFCRKLKMNLCLPLSVLFVLTKRFISDTGEKATVFDCAVTLKYLLRVVLMLYLFMVDYIAQVAPSLIPR